jgi:membrane protease YdiL (CAAX protease family)
MSRQPDLRHHPLGYRLLWFLGQLLLYASCLVALTILFQIALDHLLPAADYPDLFYLYTDWSSQLIAALLALMALNSLTLGLPLSDWGFRDQHYRVDLRFGTVLGAGIMISIFLLLWVGGWVTVTGRDWQIGPLVAWLGFFNIQPLCEEIIMRGFLQNQLHRFFGSWAGIIGTALVFMVLHAGNTHFSLLAAANIFAGGWLMGLLYLRTQSIWAPFAFHAAWNYVQSTILGFAVSGFDAYSWLRIQLDGPAWLTGGDFGAEASLPGLLLLLAAIAYFWSAHRQSIPMLNAPVATKPSDHESPSV